MHETRVEDRLADFTRDKRLIALSFMAVVIGAISAVVAKLLVKRLAEKYLPRDIVYRSKQGFTMPLDRWMAGELRTDIVAALGSDGMQRRGLMNVAVLPART